MPTSQSSPDFSPWPHRLAWLLALVTFPLIWVGGLVTTYGAGMAVPDWPTTYGYNLFLYPWSSWWHGPWNLFIEHGHRLLGALAGMLTLALAACAWWLDRRWDVRWAALAAVPLVVSQGVLGGVRVLADDVRIARLHGCTGPLFFTLCVILIWLTSRRASDLDFRLTVGKSQLVRLCWFLAVATYIQLVLGAFLRHVAVGQSPDGFRMLVAGHLIGAVAVTILAAALACRSLWLPVGSGVRWLAWGVAALVVIQLALGGGAWIVQYNWPAWMGGDRMATVVVAQSVFQSATITAHVANGSLILALAALAAVRVTCTGSAAASQPEKSWQESAATPSALEWGKWGSHRRLLEGKG